MPMNEPKFVDVEGIRTCYYEAGNGPPLVLFHGGNFGSNDVADCALDWSTNFDALARWYRVIAVDKIGQGRTANPGRDEDYRMAAVVRHACATLDRLELKGAHLVGHSRGGYLVCRMTLDRPDLAATCTIVDSSTCAPGVGLNEIVLANPPEPRLSRESQRWVLERYSYAPDHIDDGWLDALVAIADTGRYREAVEKMETEALRPRLFLPGLLRDKTEMFARMRDHGMKRPTQLVWGYNDPTATLEQGRALYDLVAARERQAQFDVINRAGHFCYRERPAAFNHVLHGFIQSVTEG